MSIINKRAIFWGLFLSFLIYSWLVYTSGTEYNIKEEYNTTEANFGKKNFQKYNCISCHQIYGLGGYMGPDLTNVITTSGKGEKYAFAFLKSGTDRMPNYQLTDEEINSLIAYLKYVGKSSNYSIEKFNTTWYGTIEPIKPNLENEE